MDGEYADAALVRRWMTELAARLHAEEGRLTALDAAIGDGDHGANMCRGVDAAVARLDEAAPDTLPAALSLAGRALISAVGGASGPLYGTALRAAARHLGEDGRADAPALGAALDFAVQSMQRLGGAAVGDKTLVDVWVPAVAAYRASAQEGLAHAARAAASAAGPAAVATVPLVARRGRARLLGEASAGHEDPGAASSALLFDALAAALQGAAAVR